MAASWLVLAGCALFREPAVIVATRPCKTVPMVTPELMACLDEPWRLWIDDTFLKCEEDMLP